MNYHEYKTWLKPDNHLWYDGTLKNDLVSNLLVRQALFAIVDLGKCHIPGKRLK